MLRNRLPLLIIAILSLSAMVAMAETVITISQPVVIPQNTVYSIPVATRYVFSNTGHFVVSAGATLLFEGRKSNSLSTDVTTFVKSGTMPTGWSAIEVNPTGKVTGKHVVFQSLPIALYVNDGKVILDSVEFSSNTYSVKIASYCDTISITNSYFLEGTNHIKACSNGSANCFLYLANNQFVGPTESAIDLYKVLKGTIEYCSFEGYGVGTAIKMESCDTLKTDYSDLIDWTSEFDILYSSPHLKGNSMEYAGDCAIRWSHDYPGPNTGQIEECVFMHNGHNTNLGAFVGYACDPVFLCNRFEDNHPYALNLSGNAAPAFFDIANSKVGGNEFFGIQGHPIVYINEAAPYFLYGENTFHLATSSDIYMQEASAKPVTHYLKLNQFANGASISHFIPADPVLWQIGTQSTGTNCGAQLGSYALETGGTAMVASAYAANGMVSSAVATYSLAIEESGDSTSEAVYSLKQLSKINPEDLPEVGQDLQQASRFSASYGYDAENEFAQADRIRNQILRHARHRDSLRVAYDIDVSQVLRPSTMKVGVQSEAARNQANIRRLAEFNELMMGSDAQIQSNPAVKLPQTINLLPVYPNPFNASSLIRFELSEASHANISVFDANGREIVTLADRNFEAGKFEVNWNGSDRNGLRVASGIYFVTMTTPKAVATRKAVLLK